MAEKHPKLEAAEIFAELETGNPQQVNEIKSHIFECLSETHEAWLVYGLYDYYLSTNSLRAVEILVSVRDGHEKHLFDKIAESLRGTTKLSALIMLGHLVRKLPPWLYKIAPNTAFKELLRLLKVEVEVLHLVNALLVLTALLPVIPTIEANTLHEIFEIFGRLAAWTATNLGSATPEAYILHLQVGVYALFHRLYGMYPCNCITFLRKQYTSRENLSIFSHTIKPLLETVRLHPLLVTVSKETEITSTRWKQMDVHDIIAECDKYVVDAQDWPRDREDSLTSSLLPRGTDFISAAVGIGPACAALFSDSMALNGDWFSPSQTVALPTGASDNAGKVSVPHTPTPFLASRGTTPRDRLFLAETATEATPETTPFTTPVKDLECQRTWRPLPGTNSVAMLLATPLPPPTPTPNPSHPTSPLKKESKDRSLSFEAGDDDRRSFILAHKLQKVVQSRQDGAVITPTIQTGAKIRSRHASGKGTKLQSHFSPSKTESGLVSPVLFSEEKSTLPPSNACRPVPQAIPSGSDALTAEDYEVCGLFASNLAPRRPVERFASSNKEKVVSLDSRASSIKDEEEELDISDEETLTLPRTSNSSISLFLPKQYSIRDFMQRFRIRYYSQCLSGSAAPSSSALNVGSPGQISASSFSTQGPPMIGQQFLQKDPKKSRSCPDLTRRADMCASVCSMDSAGTTVADTTLNLVAPVSLSDAGTQTEDICPSTPYEHLFFSVLPAQLWHECSGDARRSSASPAPADLLDKYIETAFQTHTVQGLEWKNSRAKKTMSDADELRLLRGQVLLLHSQLQYERQRRVIHAERNRRLLGKAKNTRALEEQLHVLQVQLREGHQDQDVLKKDLEFLRKFRAKAEGEKIAMMKLLDAQTKQSSQQLGDFVRAKTELETMLKEEKEVTYSLQQQVFVLQGSKFQLQAELDGLEAEVANVSLLKEQLCNTRHQLLVMGEALTALRQQQQTTFRSTAIFQQEALELAFTEQLQSYKEQLEREKRNSEALAARLAELESAAAKREGLVAEQKRAMKILREEYMQMIRAVESKYDSVKSINLNLEGKVIQLRQRLDKLNRSLRRDRRIGVPNAPGQDPSTMGVLLADESPPQALSASPGSPPSSNSLASASGGSGLSPLSVSLALEVSEGFNEAQLHNLEGVATLEPLPELPEDRAPPRRSRHVSSPAK